MSHILVTIDVVMRVGHNNGQGVSVAAMCEGFQLAQYVTKL